MKIAVVGGHLSPALAVIDALPKNTEVLFIGRKYALEGDSVFSLEYKTIAKRNIPFASVSTGRLQRIFTRHTIPSLLKIPYGLVQSFFILQKFKPDIVLSFGGYLSVPVGIVAFFLGIPLILHEQTLEAGVANRILSFFAKKICVSWESSKKYFSKEKTVLTGNPIRKFSTTGDSSTPFHFARNDNHQIIYITGGSSGSHFINALVEGCIRQLLEEFIIIHQTGDAQKYQDFDRLQKLRESLPFELKRRYRLTKFVEPEDIGLILQKADLVVSRAGINTVTELIFFKKPSLLIPIPFSQRNEQVKNALFLKSLGLAEIFYQDSLDSKKFLRYVGEMTNNIGRYKGDSRKRHSGRRSRIFLHREETESDSGVLHADALSPQNDEMGAAQKIIEVIEYAKKTNKG